MKLLAFSREGRASYGLLIGDGIVDAGSRLSQHWPSLSAVLRAGAVDELRDRVAGLGPDFSVEEASFLPPILDPGRIICVGLNYRTHIEETGRQMPEHPTIFVRFPDSHVGHRESMVCPAVSEEYDFEGELAFIVGRGGRHIPASEALGCIAGYSCYNDGSVRDFQRHASQFTAGKNFWHSGAFGPWMVTADEIPDPARLTLETRLNGKVMQSASTGDLLFDIPYLVAYLSTIFPLRPGDIVSTGTTGGVGKARKPPVFMRPGDWIEVEISGIGTLSNPVVAEDRRMSILSNGASSDVPPGR